MKKISVLLLLVSTLCFQFSPGYSRGTAPRDFYQLTVYHYNTDAQEKLLNDYLRAALLPALHRNGISKVGVFKAIANDTSTQKRLFVLIPYSSLDMITKIPTALSGDKDYQQLGKSYLDATYKDPPYTRMETILMQAFSLAPALVLPKLKGPAKDRVYELRSYESATEKIFQNKVRMFNAGDEIGLFQKLSFNAIFYGEVIAGSQMPNLMYMTSFESIADREAHWKSFRADPFWEKLSSMPEYQNNVSHIDVSLLRAAEYSDF